MKRVLMFLIAGLIYFSAATAAESADFSVEQKSEIAADLENHFAQKIVAAVAQADEEPVLSPKDQRVMLQALYAGIHGPLSKAGIDLSEQEFYKAMGRVLVGAAKYGVLPAAITIGYYSRAQLGMGKTYGSEFNFYLNEGNLRVSSYDLKSTNVGLAVAAKLGYYIALCFGACTGGDANGSYIGLDTDLVFGADANFYIEVGVDTTDYFKAKEKSESYALSDLYEAKAFYIGTGLDLGYGFGISGFFQDYQMISDIVIADLYSMMEKPNFEQQMKKAFERANLFKSAPRLH